MGALYAFCLWLTEKTRLNRIPKPIRFVFMFALLYFYAGVCGFSSSVMRAMALCLVGYAAKLIGTERDFLQSTGAAAMLILFVKPTELFAVGFQLSFVACVGIALFARPLRLAMEWFSNAVKQKCIKIFRLNERARPNPEKKKEEFLTLRNKIQTAVITFVSVSLAAQIATAPLQLYAFEYLSVWGLLLNGIFVPFISVVFSILLLFVLLSCICMPIAPILLHVPSVVWNGVLLLFEAIDFSKFVISGIKITIGSMLCYYGGWIFLTDKWNMPKAFKWGLALLCFISFGITMYALNV
jgi:competence protein ComEC